MSSTMTVMNRQARQRAALIKQRHEESRRIRHSMSTFRRTISNKASQDLPEEVQKDAEAVSESLKAMEAFVKAAKTKNGQRLLSKTHKVAEIELEASQREQRRPP